MDYIALVGWGAAAFTSAQFIPQVVKAYKTRSVTDVSLTTYLMVLASASLWITYGVGRNDQVIIAANAFIFLCGAAMVSLKLRYRRGSEGHHRTTPKPPQTTDDPSL